ncbi:hypothetical protein ACOCEA_02935 [Maribacter sp. CXY002]|uniref:hypothetical protein n=1 Tax=Maribacter luteocoastalis TaxID=3407671 RepID=UPI003B6735F6
MKLLLIAFIIALTIDVAEVRLKYPQALNDPQVTEELYAEFIGLPEGNNGVLLGYKGAIYTLKAKHSKVIKEKKIYFKQGIALLETAIGAHPENLELRFIRLSIQEHAPKIVKYNSNLQEDKLFILTDFKNAKEKAVKKLIKNYIVTSALFTDEEKQLF